MQKNNLKKGVIFTISVFILAAVLLDLTSFLAQHNDHSQSYFLPPADAQILNSKLEELSYNSKRNLDFDVDLQRNKDNLTIRLTGMSMPFYNLSGRADLAGFKGYYENQWAQQNNLSCQLDTDQINATGTLLQTSNKINYSQINSLSIADYSQFEMPYTYNFSRVQIDIYCIAPQNTSYIQYDEWANSGTQKRATINYADNLGNTRTNSVLFSQSVDETFSASYYDVDDAFLQKFEFNLINKSLLNISSQVNFTYGWFRLRKPNVSCQYNLTVSLNYTNTTPIYLYMPIDTNLSYKSASYRGFLPIAKK